MDFHVDQALLSVIATSMSVITGAITMGVKYLFNLQVSVKELNLKILPVIDTMHEFRLLLKDCDKRLTIVETKTHKENYHGSRD